MRSPAGVPPGSRVTSGARPAAVEPLGQQCLSWVVLPVPSGPSKVTKRPAPAGPGLVAAGIVAHVAVDADAPVRLPAVGQR